MNFRYKLMQFMSGRYGVDRTFYVLFVIGAFFALLNCFLRLIWIQLIVYAIIIVAFLRFFSKNIDKRIKENEIVTGWIYKVSQSINKRKQRTNDTTHIYKKCPNCKAVLRLPRTKGIHTTVCPRCHKSFKVRVFRG
ncbi:MAG: hypothetical protein MJ090_01415 [Clostridia bacterium]|nr:hypothetical protein [Clostridia bacterium]